MSDEPTYAGPRIGDRVSVQTAGSVVELYARDGVPGVTVTLDDMGTTWVPMTQVAVLEQRP
jgi:hypothetical protein